MVSNLGFGWNRIDHYTAAAGGNRAAEWVLKKAIQTAFSALS